MDNIDAVFEELKNRSVLNEGIKLIMKAGIPTLQASFLFNEIYCNPSFSNSDKDILRFMLLHEAGHKQNPTYEYLLIFVLFLSYIILHLFLKISTVDKILLFFLLSVLEYRLFFPFLRKSEFNADIYASKKMIEVYRVKKPSIISRKSFKELKKVNFKLNLLNLVFGRIDYHPKPEERAQRIKEFEESRMIKY